MKHPNGQDKNAAAQWEPPADCVAWTMPKETMVWVEVTIEKLGTTDKVPFWIAPGTLIAGHPNMLRMAGAMQPKPKADPHVAKYGDLHHEANLPVEPEQHTCWKGLYFDHSCKACVDDQALPCPFCGDAPNVQLSTGTGLVAKCRSCLIDLPLASWNTRR